MNPPGLFEAFGVEIEYMIVDQETLDVRPICDELFQRATGSATNDVADVSPDGVIAWSNELALHVVELKTDGPAKTLDGLDQHFQNHVRRIDGLLASSGARLLPGGMHPWMDPHRETRLWPHENTEIYRAYDRIFGCRGHGWGNLQSTHLNLPFNGDEEFGRLYAAIRLVLPLLPALAASTPIVEGQLSPLADHRLEVYRTNADRVPRMAGLVIPEPTWSRASFEAEVLQPLYADLRPLDPEGVLAQPFANARGGMARFDRGAVEIRLLDTQECPRADLAVVALIAAVVRALVEERWTDRAHQQQIATEPLHAVLLETIRGAERTRVRCPTLLAALGIDKDSAWATDVWAALLEATLPNHPTWTPTLRKLIDAGTLSTRLTRRLRNVPTRPALREIYGDLADCLRDGELFDVAR